MNFRNCEIKDIQACAKLFAAVYSEEPYRETWNFADARRYLERFQKIDPEGCFVVIVNNRVVGAIFSFSYPWHSGKQVCIQELFVSRKHRKKGIAPKLINCINNGEKISAWLVAHQRSEASLFYQKMGFSSAGPYKFRHGKIN